MSSSSGDDQLQPPDTLDQRLEQEEPDPVAAIDHTEQGELDEIVDPDEPTDPSDGFEVGAGRTGRLADPGSRDTEPLPAAEEVGVDAAAASAEEAAMHTVEEDEA
jgi:hypothetical protein